MSIGRLVYYATEERRGALLRASVVMSQARRTHARGRGCLTSTSANRDETVFSDPGRLDIRRQPNRHVALGHGPHFCLGAQLARVQMRALFAEVLTQMGQLEYNDTPAYLRSNFQRGVKRLPIRWSRTARPVQ